ncbi:hypothetical protein EJ08DRAFT_402860 [Tothia fuscella]|uniref:F-box domain-containing protein n=1 Tax=Tothia fuscella TaxID=1048955 RepID=A0A9P4NKL1_9PEZI|nr:hypothetical protein EJ08DRAFT_402860 [Tothia fuscella]
MASSLHPKATSRRPKAGTINMTATIDDLPIELVDRILFYMPNHDNILQLRCVNRDLASKTSRSFAKAYFAESTWNVNGRTIRALGKLSKTTSICFHMTSVHLVGPTESAKKYENFLLAKGLDAAKLRIALRALPSLSILKFENFEYKDSHTFFRKLLVNLPLATLTTFHLEKVTVSAASVATFIKRNKKILQNFDFDTVNLKGPEEECGHAIPWATMLQAILSIKKTCDIGISNPKVSGKDALLLPDIDLYDEEFYFKSLYISYERETCDSEDEGGYWSGNWEDENGWWCYHVRAEEQWRESLELLIRYYEYRIHQCEDDSEPPCYTDEEDMACDCDVCGNYR